MNQLWKGLVVAIFFLSSCSTDDKATKILLEEGNTIEKDGVKLIPILTKKEEEQKFDLAEFEQLENSEKLKLKFETSLSNEVEIHYSVNNGKISKSKITEFQLDLLEGNNVVMAYLSLENGLRLSSDSVVFIRNCYVGKNQSEFNASEPHLFHHFSEEVDSNDFIVGFYLSHLPRSTHCQVKFEIDGTNFLLPYDKAFKVVGLSKGIHTLRIQLVNEKEQLIFGPFNDSGIMQVNII